MAKQQPITPLFTIIMAGVDTTVQLPNGPAGGGQPIALGFEYVVVDDLGTAGTSHIAINGPITGGSSGTSITSNYGSAWFRWEGSTFVQKQAPSDVSRYETVSPSSGIIWADNSTHIALPASPNASGQPLLLGLEILVIDNLQIATNTPITIVGPLAGGGSSTQLSTSGGAFRFKWTGLFYMMG